MWERISNLTINKCLNMIEYYMRVIKMERNYFDKPLSTDDLLEFITKKEKYDNSKVYTSEEDFVFIHKTNYPLKRE